MSGSGGPKFCAVHANSAFISLLTSIAIVSYMEKKYHGHYLALESQGSARILTSSETSTLRLRRNGIVRIDFMSPSVQIPRRLY